MTAFTSTATTTCIITWRQANIKIILRPKSGGEIRHSAPIPSSMFSSRFTHVIALIQKPTGPWAEGIALGNALKMTGILESKEGPESFDGLLNHEVGHILGLEPRLDGRRVRMTPTRKNTPWQMLGLDTRTALSRQCNQ